MATRENQTLQITLIVMTLIVLLLGVIAIVLLNSKNTWQARADQAEKERDQSRNTLRTNVAESGDLKTWMGFSAEETQDAIQSQFTLDMEKFGQTFEKKSYRDILEYIWEENTKSSEREAVAKDQVGQLTAALEALEAQKEAQIASTLQQLEQAAQELKQARAEFDEDRQTLADGKAQLADKVASQESDFRLKIDEAQSKVTTLEDDLRTAERRLEAAQTKLQGQIPNLEVPDGSVTLVDHTTGTVWIDRGFADALRPQVTFSIYNAEENDADGAVKKGSIEITRVLDDHMSEGRITFDDPTDPILRGDKIYSQIWHPGEQQHFAITGRIDLDGDGRSDLAQLLDIIEINNAVVDSKMDEDGNVAGNMSINTRYLVLGELPTDAQYADLSRGWEAMTKQADKLGIRKIPLRHFLDQMGWRAERKSVTLGRGARPDNFPPQRQEVRPPRPRGTSEQLLRRVGANR